MEARELIYKHGHFYDAQSKKRVELAEGSGVSINIENRLSDSVPAGTWPLKVVNGIEKEESIKKEIGIKSYHKILSSGSSLFFSISRGGGKKKIIYEFRVELLEDLYFYLKVFWKKKDERLYNCACVVRENTTKNIDFFEEVNAISLNEIYKNTFVHYFENKGNPACNAIERFYEEIGNDDSTIERYRNK